ncbi:hypothetical protein ACOSQ2_009687 [Xanthoceras sorbifolium]
MLEEDRNMVGWSFLDFVFYCSDVVVWSKAYFKEFSAASASLKEFAGLDAVVRDCRGKIVVAGCSLGGRGFSPQCVEAKAMCFGLSIALEAGFLPILLEYDAFSVVNLVTSKSPPYSEIGLFILDILNLLKFPSVCGVSYSCRSTNMIVHSLTKLAFSFSSESIWVANFLHSVESFISADLAGL